MNKFALACTPNDEMQNVDALNGSMYTRIFLK